MLVKFLTRGRKLLKSAATLAKKLLVNDKIIALYSELQTQKALFKDKFCFLGNFCCQYLNFVLQVAYCFLTSC